MEPIKFSVLPSVELFQLVSVTLDTDLNKWLLNWNYFYDKNCLYFNTYTELSVVKKVFDEVNKRGNRVEMILNSELNMIVFKFVVK